MIKTIPKIWGFLYISLLISGCSAVLIAGTGGGVTYTITNIAYKTVIYPMAKVEEATHKTLKNMGIKETGKKNTENGIEISASTSELNIYIELERVTSKTTQIRVDAQKNIIIKDKATATEIIEETEKILEGEK